HGARERRARARAEFLGLRDSTSRRRADGRIRLQAAARLTREQSPAARPGQDGGGLCAPAASAAPTARGTAPIPATPGAGGDGRHGTGRTCGEGDRSLSPLARQLVGGI